MNDGLALFQPQFLEHAVELVGPENAHQVVLKRQEEFRGAGVALTAGPPAKLVVDPAGFVTLGADDIEAAGGKGLFLQGRHFGADLLALASPASCRRISRLPPSWMSVPRPAMLVAMVTAPGTPASAMIRASSA